MPNDDHRRARLTLMKLDEHSTDAEFDAAAEAVADWTNVSADIWNRALLDVRARRFIA